LSLRLLIDEDTQDARLVSMLRTEGHDVLTVNEAGLRGQADSAVLAHAARDQHVVLTPTRREKPRPLREAGAFSCAVR